LSKLLAWLIKPNVLLVPGLRIVF